MSISSASTSQSQIDLVFVFDVDDLTLLSNEQVKNIFPGKVIASVLMEKKRRLAYGIKQNWSKDAISKLEDDALARIEEDEDLQMFRVYWETVKNFLQLVKQKNEKTKKVAIFVLCEDGTDEGQAMLRISSLASEVPFESLHANDRHSERKFFNFLKNQFGSTCEFRIVTSRERTLALADEVNRADEIRVSKEVIEPGKNFQTLHDHWSAIWFPSQQEGFQPSTRRSVYGVKEKASKKRPTGGNEQGDEQKRKRKAEEDADWHPSTERWNNGRGKKENRRRQTPK